VGGGLLRNRFRPKLQLPPVNKYPPIHHLIAKIRVEKARFKTLIKLAQAIGSLSSLLSNHH
jgi:hypothetical protein